MTPLPIYPSTVQLAVETATPRDRDSNCQACVLHEGVRTVCLPAELCGAKDGPLLMVVGAFPGQTEDRNARPFMGTTGQYIRRLLEGMWKGRVVFDYALGCAAGVRKPTSKKYDACRGYLAAVYNELKPARVLLLGTEACHALIGRGYPTMSVRKGFAHTSDGTPVFIAMNPGLGLRNRFVRGWVEEDFHWALTANPEQKAANAVYFQITTAEEAQEAVEELYFAGGFTGDAETFGKPFTKEQTILDFAVTPFDEVVAYCWDEAALNNPKVSAPLFRALRDPNLPKGGQNWKFDCVHLQAKYGVVVRGTTFDTKLQRRILIADSDAKLVNLQALVGMGGGKDVAAGYVKAGVRELGRLLRKPGTPTELFANVEPWKLEIALKKIDGGENKKTFAYAAIPKGPRAQYCGTDTISADLIRQDQERTMVEQPWARDVWTTEACGMNYALTQMECNGLLMSREGIIRLRAQMDLEIDQHKAALAKYGNLNVNADRQVQELLFTKLGLKPGKRTKTGFSVAADILQGLNHPAATAIIGLKKATKFRNQYCNGMERFIQDDGRIHCNFNQDGTVTGRPSCKDPNWLNIPRANTSGGKLCRDLLVAEDGYELVEGDYSQIELRVAAFLSGDEAMIDIFQRGVDFHLETARLIAPLFHVEPSDVHEDHPLRDRAKTVNFELLYGGTVPGLAKKLGTTNKIAKQLRGSVLGAFPRLAVWIAESLAFSRRTGHCRTWWDGRDFRSRPLWRIADSDDASRETAERSSWNTKAQGTGASFTNNSLGRMQLLIEDELIPARQVLTVYDSIIWEVETGAVDELIHLARGVMESWNSGPVPLKVDFKHGRTWGSCQKVL